MKVRVWVSSALVSLFLKVSQTSDRHLETKPTQTTQTPDHLDTQRWISSTPSPRGNGRSWSPSRRRLWPSTFLSFAANRSKCPARICGESQSKISTSTASGSAFAIACSYICNCSTVALVILAYCGPAAEWRTGRRSYDFPDRQLRQHERHRCPPRGSTKLNNTQFTSSIKSPAATRRWSSVLPTMPASNRVSPRQSSDLRKAVENILPTNRATDISDALRVAAGLSLPSATASATEEDSTCQTEPTKLFILSDGKFPPAKDISLGNMDPVFISIGRTENGSATVSNVGTGFFRRRRDENQDDRLQAFGNLHNFGSKASHRAGRFVLERFTN